MRDTLLFTHVAGFCALWNSVASLQYAAGLLQIEGAGYAIPSVIPSALALYKSQAAMDSQREAILDLFAGGDERCGTRIGRLLPTCLRPSDAQLALAAARRPVAFLAGMEDAIVPALSSRTAAAMTQGAWLAQVEGAGHAVVHSHPEAIARFFQGFVAQFPEQPVPY